MVFGRQLYMATIFNVKSNYQHILPGINQVSDIYLPGFTNVISVNIK
jgi:hypothetical protein